MRLPGARPAWPHLALAAYVALAFAALTWPGYDLAANRVEPFVLGLPFHLFWVAAWAALTCLVLAGYHALTSRGS